MVRMCRRGREYWRAAIRAEVTSELTSTIAALREHLRSPGSDPETGRVETHADIERTTGQSPTVFTVAVVRRAHGSVVFVNDLPAGTASRDSTLHRVSPDTAFLSLQDRRTQEG